MQPNPKVDQRIRKGWQAQGIEGSFSNEFFLQFHMNLISGPFPHGQIQVLRISTPDTLLGFLYSFIYNNRVYFYQSGSKYLTGNIYRPSLASHLKIRIRITT